MVITACGNSCGAYSWCLYVPLQTGIARLLISRSHPTSDRVAIDLKFPYEDVPQNIGDPGVFYRAMHGRGNLGISKLVQNSHLYCGVGIRRAMVTVVFLLPRDIGSSEVFTFPH